MISLKMIYSCSLLLLASYGCGGATKYPAAPDAIEAKERLETALKAWKNGRLKSLNERKPSVRFVDQDHAAGRVLETYSLAGEPEPVGPTLNFPVMLKLRNRRGASQAVAAVYQVVLTPEIAVFRNDP